MVLATTLSCPVNNNTAFILTGSEGSSPHLDSGRSQRALQQSWGPVSGSGLGSARSQEPSWFHHWNKTQGLRCSVVTHMCYTYWVSKPKLTPVTERQTLYAVEISPTGRRATIFFSWEITSVYPAELYSWMTHWIINRIIMDLNDLSVRYKSISIKSGRQQSGLSGRNPQGYRPRGV